MGPVELVPAHQKASYEAKAYYANPTYNEANEYKGVAPSAYTQQYPHQPVSYTHLTLPTILRV